VEERRRKARVYPVDEGLMKVHGVALGGYSVKVSFFFQCHLSDKLTSFELLLFLLDIV
jgi:hypothetical protein